MEQTLDFIRVVQQVVLNPTFGSAIALFFVSFLNEFLVVLPYAVILAGQLFFLDDPLTLAFVSKLFIFVALPVGVGAALGCVPVYVLSYYGGRPLINRFQKYLRFSWHDVEKLSRHFRGERYDDIVFLLLRSIPILPSLPLNVAAGVLRMPFMSYFVLTAVGFIVRMMLTLLIVGLGIESLSNFLIFLYTD